MRKTIMAASSAIRRDKSKFQKWLHKWVGSNRGTHWSIAGSVAVIILGSYLIYDIRVSNSTSAAAIGVTGPPPASTTLTFKK
jgi:hypothetical protein